jgi:hypothetical protein
VFDQAGNPLHPTTTMSLPHSREGSSGEARILGIDRRTIGPALLVLALAVLMGIVLPAIDSRTAYSHQVEKGDVALLADGITLVPAPGWSLASGALAGHARSPVGDTFGTELVDGGADFSVQTAPFAGTPSALLTRVDEINGKLSRARGRTSTMSDRYLVSTRQGATGVAEDFEGATREGTIVAFVVASPSPSLQGQPSREGIEVVVSGPKGTMASRRDEVVAMIRGIRVAP